MAIYILLKSAFHATAVLALLSYLPRHLLKAIPLHNLAVQIMGADGHVAFVWLAVFSSQLFWSMRSRKQKEREANASVYGLQHGRLHLQLPTAMWMNMGYWKTDHGSRTKTPKTMAEACRDLLNAVLTEAGLMYDSNIANHVDKKPRPMCILDIGFGCGDQTIYMMSNNPVRPCDKQWWDSRNQRVQFDQYIGITKDPTQYQFATERVRELVSGSTRNNSEQSNVADPGSKITLFCADAATPDKWDQDLQKKIEHARESSADLWVLALDTAYHFSPSRWPLITYACSDLDASFMAFDLCLSPTASLVQRLILRVLTTLMGAPWLNFVTPHEYRQKLVEAGYPDTAVQVKDISEHVFTPLSAYMAEQDQRLKAFGLGIGGLKVAKWMFGWWGETGVVRGVIVVAKKV